MMMIYEMTWTLYLDIDDDDDVRVITQTCDMRLLKIRKSLQPTSPIVFDPSRYLSTHDNHPLPQESIHVWIR